MLTCPIAQPTHPALVIPLYALLVSMFFAGCNSRSDLPDPTTSALNVAAIANSAPESSPRRPTTALLLVDVQYDFYSAVETNPAMEDNVAKLLRTCRERNIEVIHVRTEMNPDRSAWPKSFQTMFETTPCVAGTYGADPLACATHLDGETILTKQTFDAFNSGELEPYLKRQQIEHLWLAGVTTDVCILSTAFGAMNRGITVTVVDDCSAAHSAQVHEFVLQRYDGLVFNRLSLAEFTQAVATDR